MEQVEEADRRRPHAASARSVVAALYARHGVRARARHHHRRHEVRVRPRRERHAARHGRSADAGLVALLARGHLQGRLLAAELRQAIHPRLSRDARLEQAGAGPEAAARRHRAHAREVRRGARSGSRANAPHDGGSRASSRRASMEFITRPIERRLWPRGSTHDGPDAAAGSSPRASRTRCCATSCTAT